jgi:hypothetical protein
VTRLGAGAARGATGVQTHGKGLGDLEQRFFGGGGLRGGLCAGGLTAKGQKADAKEQIESPDHGMGDKRALIGGDQNPERHGQKGQSRHPKNHACDGKGRRARRMARPTAEVRDKAAHRLFPACEEPEQKAHPDRKANRGCGLVAHGVGRLLAHVFGAVLCGVQLFGTGVAQL